MITSLMTPSPAEGSFFQDADTLEHAIDAVLTSWHLLKGDYVITFCDDGKPIAVLMSPSPNRFYVFNFGAGDMEMLRFVVSHEEQHNGSILTTYSMGKGYVR